MMISDSGLLFGSRTV